MQPLSLDIDVEVQRHILYCQALHLLDSQSTKTWSSTKASSRVAGYATLIPAELTTSCHTFRGSTSPRSALAVCIMLWNSR